jgi:lathosterol oxidase
MNSWHVPLAWGLAVVTAPNALMVALALAGSLALSTLAAGRKIQRASAVTATRSYELSFACVTVLISGLIGATTVYLVQRQLIVLRYDRAGLTIARELGLYFVAFDFYFYVVHRVQHLPAFFRFHQVHHRSTAPNPLSAFSAHPVDTLMTGCFSPLFWMVVSPVHLWTLIAISLYYGAATTVFHSGYDLYPTWWQRRWFSKWYLTSRYHDLHHSEGRWNYGGYTILWDWIFGTMAPEVGSQEATVPALCGRYPSSEAS